MNKHFVSGFLIVLLSFFVVPIVSAHGDEPRIEIDPESLNPGAVLDIRGVDFELDEEIILTLVGPQNEVPLGSVIADAEGIFLLTVTLPADIQEGTYVVRAITDDHALNSPPITIWGGANLGGSEETRSEEDALLAPMPTFAPGVVPNDAASQPKPQTPQPASPPTVRAGGNVWMAALMVLGAGILTMLGLRIIRKQK